MQGLSTGVKCRMHCSTGRTCRCGEDPMVLDWPPTVTTTETLLAETPGGTLQRSMVWSWYVTVHGALPSRITVMPSLGPPKLSPVASQWISPSQ